MNNVIKVKTKKTKRGRAQRRVSVTERIKREQNQNFEFGFGTIVMMSVCERVEDFLFDSQVFLNFNTIICNMYSKLIREY